MPSVKHYDLRQDVSISRIRDAEATFDSPSMKAMVKENRDVQSLAMQIASARESRSQATFTVTSLSTAKGSSVAVHRLGARRVRVQATGSQCKPIKNDMRPDLMLQLIDRKVNLESRTRNAKQNTACTLASAQGGGTMYEILVAAGGDINATTADPMSSLWNATLAMVMWLSA